MAEIEDALKTYLLTQSGLTALIQNRIYAEDEVPLKAGDPYVFYLNVSDIPNHTHDGQDSLRQPMIQYSACSKTKTVAAAVAKQIEAAMNDHSGTLSGIEVQFIRLEGVDKSAETNAEGTVKIHFVDLEYQVNYIKT